MRKIVILLKSFLLLCSLSLLGCGSSALHWVQVGDKITVPGSEKVVSQKLQIENIQPPTKYSPVISFQVALLDKLNSEFYYQLKEVKKEWGYSSHHNWFYWTIGWVLLAPLWVYFVPIDQADDNIHIPPLSLDGREVLKFEKGKFYPQTGNIIISWAPTGKTMNGETKNEFNESKIHIKNSKIIAKVNYQEKEFSTDYFGEVKVDLVKDFNLIRADNDNPIDVFISDIERKLSTTISIKPSDWMYEFIKATSNNIEVVGESGSKTIILGKLKTGEEYKLVHKGSQLWKIDFNGNEGFIPPNSGEIFWAVPNYKYK